MQDGELKPEVKSRLSEKEEKELIQSLDRLKEISIMESLYLVVTDPDKFEGKLDLSDINAFEAMFNKTGVSVDNKKALSRIERMVELMPAGDINLKQSALDRIKELEER